MFMVAVHTHVRVYMYNTFVQQSKSIYVFLFHLSNMSIYLFGHTCPRYILRSFLLCHILGLLDLISVEEDTQAADNVLFLLNFKYTLPHCTNSNMLI